MINIMLEVVRLFVPFSFGSFAKSTQSFRIVVEPKKNNRSPQLF